MASVFLYHTNLLLSGGCNLDLVWAVENSEMAVATCFGFLATACDGIPSVARFDEELHT